MALLPNYTDTGGGVGLPDALEMLNDPRTGDGSLAAAGRRGPGRSAVAAARVGAGGEQGRGKVVERAAEVRV